MTILGGVIALELAGVSKPVTGYSLEAANPPGEASPAVGTTGDLTASWVGSILARPLFTPSRRGAAASAVAVANNALPRLSGIMITPTKKTAVFTPAAGLPIMAQEGGEIGLYTVRSIDPNYVVVTGPRGIQILHMTFDATGAADAAPPPAAPANPFSLFNSIGHMPGDIWTNSGKPNLPSAATWSGPPPLTRLPVTRPSPASSPLLAPSGPTK